MPLPRGAITPERRVRRLARPGVLRCTTALCRNHATYHVSGKSGAWSGRSGSRYLCEQCAAPYLAALPLVEDVGPPPRAGGPRRTSAAELRESRWGKAP
jgi:hypothetical protein